jgi:uncharacterized protein YndB with AHSA1/START domain
MSNRETYAPGPAAGAEVQKAGDTWTLVLVRELRHPLALVWQALTDPGQLSQWAPFDADRSLAAEGPVKLTTIGAPPEHAVTVTRVKRADAPRALEYTWGGGDMRWELQPLGDSGTRLTLWSNINRGWIAAGAAGWHICFDVLDRLLGDEPIGRMAGPGVMQFAGWQRLTGEYAKQFGVEPPAWLAAKKN